MQQEWDDALDWCEGIELEDLVAFYASGLRAPQRVEPDRADACAVARWAAVARSAG